VVYHTDCSVWCPSKPRRLELTDIVAAAAGDPKLTERTWVLITESPAAIAAKKSAAR
jgi:hypothetical protein